MKKEIKKRSVEENIISLYKLQQIKSKVDEINRIKGELPYEVQDLSDEVEGLQTRLENLNSRIEELVRLSKESKAEIEAAHALIKKYQEQQNNVRNNREFESISKEIEYQELEIQLLEKHIKQYAEEQKEKKVTIETVNAVLADKKIAYKEKKEELDSIDKETAKDIEMYDKQATEVSEDIDERLLTAFNKIRSIMKNGLAVVTVKRDACSGCFNRIPPQRQLDIRMSKKLIVCEYCGRILVSDELEQQ
ncbi:MAG: C4-type zinc ribbon domain-containing protein [Rikenellaceae bacterium]